MSRALSLAGFQVTLIGRIWVTPEGLAGRSQVRAHDQEYCRKIWHFAAPFGTHYFASICIDDLFSCAKVERVS